MVATSLIPIKYGRRKKGRTNGRANWKNNNKDSRGQVEIGCQSEVRSALTGSVRLKNRAGVGEKTGAGEEKAPVLQSATNVRKTMGPVGPIQFIYGAGARCVGPQLRMRRALSARDEGGICMDTFSVPVGFESRFGRHEFVRDTTVVS